MAATAKLKGDRGADHPGADDDDLHGPTLPAPPATGKPARRWQAGPPLAPPCPLASPSPVGNPSRHWPPCPLANPSPAGKPGRNAVVLRHGQGDPAQQTLRRALPVHRPRGPCDPGRLCGRQAGLCRRPAGPGVRGAGGADRRRPPASPHRRSPAQAGKDLSRAGRGGHFRNRPCRAARGDAEGRPHPARRRAWGGYAYGCGPGCRRCGCARPSPMAGSS